MGGFFVSENIKEMDHIQNILEGDGKSTHRLSKA